jgi:hypothetical protein
MPNEEIKLSIVAKTIFFDEKDTIRSAPEFSYHCSSIS